MSRPLAIDLFCGLGGWTEGLLSEGFDVIGFDVEQHVYGDHRYPAQLVLQDVRTIHGAQFRDASLIVASSPCQEFSYRAMPWKRAKALGPPLLGMELFAQAARIQLEACAAAGRYIPMIQENVRGAERWVGRARWHFGSFYLWGDVPALMPEARRLMKNKSGGSWFAVGPRGEKAEQNNARDRLVAASGVKQPGVGGTRTNGKGDRWFQDGAAASGSKSPTRKAASARIAKIPLPLAAWIGHCYHPDRLRGVA